MARGSKNYFRHLINAYLDPKIQRAIDEIGLEGYACFFIILEIVAEQCENEFKKEVTIHKRVIANALRKRSDSVNLVVTKLELSGLLSSHYDGTNFQLSVPNLAKYMGRYEIKSDLNVPNKKKEKEKKVNKSKENKINGENGFKESLLSFDEAWQMYPEKSGKKQAEKHFNATVKTPEDFESIKIAIKNYLQSPKPQAGFIKNGSTFFNDWKAWINPTPSMMINNAKNANSMLYMPNPYETNGE